MLWAESDIVTVCLGLNDVALLPSQLELVCHAVEHDLSFLAARLRGVPVVVAPYFPAVGVGPRFELVRRMVHEQSATVGLMSTDAMSLAVDGDTDKLSIDGIHPDDAGHAAIARAMIQLYEELVPALCTPGAQRSA